MPMDWFIVLAPLLLLPIAFLFVFVGCSLQDFGTAYLNVTLVWQPPLGTDVAELQIEVTGYVPSKLATSGATATVPDPNEVYFGQKSRGWTLTLSADWAESKEDMPSDSDVISCSLQVSLFDAQGNKLLLSDGKPKVPFHEKSGTRSVDGDHWCFQLDFTASSDDYSISDIPCPQGP
jgi:hypothetical protein